MKTDLELINLASKASGFEYTHNSNPLHDDALALRLAVKLGLHVAQDPDNKMVAVFFTEPDEETTTVELWDADPYAATRRAIVRAAAAIGAQA